MAIAKGAIMAAGEGSRLASLGAAKPLVQVGGQPLICHQLGRLLGAGPFPVTVALNASLEGIDFSTLPGFSDPRVTRLFLRTPSSLHTFHAITTSWEPFEGHILAGMVDTIVADGDFATFLSACGTLRAGESLLLLTRYVNDETPVSADVEQGYVRAIGAPLRADSLVTSGLYCFSHEVLPVLESCLRTGVHRMRSFLARLVDAGHPVRAYTTDKTIDVDRPEDLREAEAFLGRSTREDHRRD
jgi:choline kinase